jgi:hypothetical protein
MSKRLLLATTLFSAASVAQAQVRFALGPQVGYNLTTVNYNTHDPGVAISNKYLSGFAAGIAADIGFGHVAIQPAVQFARKGYDQTGTNRLAASPIVTSVQMRFNYLAVPINVAYTQHRNGQGAQVFAGPYVGFLLGGHYTAETTYPGAANTNQAGKVVAANSYTPNVNEENTYSQRVDAGLQFGLGYRYQGLLVQAAYSLGLRNQASVQEALPGGYRLDYPSTYYNRAFQLSLAYLFGPKF